MLATKLTRGARAVLMSFAAVGCLMAGSALAGTPGFTAIGEFGEYRINGVRDGEVKGERVKLLDVTLRNTSQITTFPGTIQEVRWQGRNTGAEAQPLHRDLTGFGMYDFVKPGQAVDVTYVIPAREDIDGVSVEYPKAGTGPKKRVFSWAQLGTAEAGAKPAVVKTAATPAAGALTVPAGAASFQHYGPWQFKVDELTRGPDGHIQAVISVKNASQQRLPFSIADFEAYLIDENGRGIRRLGNLYRASPAGPASALAPAGTNNLEPGDEMRARILFQNSKTFQPAELRLKEPVRSLTTNTYPMH